jgi:hypothetical protein
MLPKEISLKPFCARLMAISSLRFDIDVRALSLFLIEDQRVGLSAGCERGLSRQTWQCALA